MAVNISVFDLENYPGNSKSLTVDLKSVVPTGSYGDEKWVLSATTTATASGSAKIQDVYVDSTKVGWSKSSGIPQEPFSLNAGANQLKVAIDEPAASGVTITLNYDTLPLTGDAVAEDIQNRLKATTVVGGAKAGNLSYLNAKCYYTNGKFIITSGSMSRSFSGVGRSSVRVSAAASNDCSAVLGFDIPLESEVMDSVGISQTSTSAQVSSSTTVPVASVTGFAIGDCIALKTNTGDIYYRYLDNVANPNLTVNANVTVPSGTMVQLLRMQDPASEPASFFTDVDSSLRAAIDMIVNQINFA